MVELAGDFELRFHLFDETVVLLLFTHNVLEGVNLARLGIVDSVDGTTPHLLPDAPTPHIGGAFEP